jgi:hypothetical protein
LAHPDPTGFADTRSPGAKTTHAPGANSQTFTLLRLRAGEGIPITTVRNPDLAGPWASGTPERHAWQAFWQEVEGLLRGSDAAR